MLKFYSTYSISKKFSDDIWTKVFRFNKNVRIFKHLAISRYFEKRKRFPVRVKRFHELRFKLRRFKSNFAKRLVQRKKFRIFYGNLSERKFRVMFFNLKGKVGYPWFAFLFSKFEFKAQILTFRASYFRDTKTTFQLVKHGHLYRNGYRIYYFQAAKLTDVVSFPLHFFNYFEMYKLIRKRRFIFPTKYFVPSYRLPFILILRTPEPKYLKKTFNFDILNFTKSYS
jgi:hypothetical protein